MGEETYSQRLSRCALVPQGLLTPDSGELFLASRSSTANGKERRTDRCKGRESEKWGVWWCCMRKRQSGGVHVRGSDCACVYVGKVKAGGVGMPWK